MSKLNILILFSGCDNPFSHLGLSIGGDPLSIFLAWQTYTQFPKTQRLDTVQENWNEYN